MTGWRRRRARLGAAGAAILTVGVLAAINQSPAFGDAHAPPPFPTNCPVASGPPPGYPNPPPPASTPFVYTGTAAFDPGTHAYSGLVPLEVPFKGIIFGGQIKLPPNVVIPNLYASLCGLVTLPSLAGTIAPANLNLATPNIYIAGLEALPASVKFATLVSSIVLTPAHNGGLDITLRGPTTAGVTTLGMTCSITLNANFKTGPTPDGILTGKPVTGPTKSGQAEVVSNSFPVPAVQPSTLCPPSIAQTFNKLLGLPVGPGVGTFIAPFCFDFELEGINTPTPTAQCPWPK